jgi:mycothione reductase
VSTPQHGPDHFDVAVIGSGSGNSVIDDGLADRRVALLEQGTFGGTCLNVGCIPTKMFVYPADLAQTARHGPRLGVDTAFTGARWRDIRDRVFGRIDPISSFGRDWRLRAPNVTLFEGHARFVDVRTLDTGTGRTITADQIVVAAGSRPVVPDIEGLAETGFHTSDTIMRIDEVPPRLLVLGGGYVSAELAHVFSTFGSRVTVVNRSDGLLRALDRDVARRFTELAQQRWDVRLGAEVTKVERYGEGARAQLSDGSTVEADAILVGVGRRSNADGLDLHRTGVRVDPDGVIPVDDFQRTAVEGIWALGDVSNRHQLKHVANHEARVVRHNLLHADDPAAMVRSRRDAVPSAVFSEPEIGSVGLTEQDAVRQGVEHVVAHQAYQEVAFGWAMEDTTGFAKLLADPRTGRILGAHILGPQAANLIQPVVQAMSFGQTARELARGQYWIHPALTEVVENVALGVG